MRNTLSILCMLILSTIVEAASRGLLMAETTSCTDRTETAMTQTDSIIAPKTKLTRLDDTALRRILTPGQYAVTQQAATKRSFTNEYGHEFREGIYVDITTGEPLFSSTDKFDSGRGWSAFSKPVDKKVIINHAGTSHGVVHTEVRSRTDRVHLGHVFDDGPVATRGKRYCTNNTSLRFIPLERMKAKDYEAYIELARPMKEIYVAGGCFRGTEHYFKQMEGVTTAEVGYANGIIRNPTHEEVCTDKTQFAEAVHITYGPKVISLDFLLGLCFRSIDPTNIDKQGNDRGSQYCTGVYYTNPANLPTIKKAFEEGQKQIHEKIAVEMKPLESFYTAGEYHQDYLDKHPTSYRHLPTAFFEYAHKAKMKK